VLGRSELVQEVTRIMSRATKKQVEARVTEILRCLLDGAEVWDLVDFVRKREAEAGSCWTVKEGAKPLGYSMIRRYAARAEKLYQESCRGSRKKLIRRHLARRRHLYRKAVSQGDTKAALAAIRDEAELLGLYPPKGMAVTGKAGGPV